MSSRDFIAEPRLKFSNIKLFGPNHGIYKTTFNLYELWPHSLPGAARVLCVSAAVAAINRYSTFFIENYVAGDGGWREKEMDTKPRYQSRAALQQRCRRPIQQLARALNFCSPSTQL
jgi:hypothetical protein